MTSPVITRFPPSPTGYLHIGGARTALFNWLYARSKGGKMLLRIEDTDRERSTADAVEKIFEALKWLGLSWDGEPVFQSRRLRRHREVARSLLNAGLAYRCYASQEELARMRARARAQGRAVRYDGRWRDRDPLEAPAGIVPVIRLKSRLKGETVIEDRVQGRVVFANSELDDLVLLRGDGTPTYMLSVVVDDHDMSITHVIRGDDHLTNAARQCQIYEALGWNRPEFAHIPLIHGPDGAKLSKRHGALGVEAYRDMGYLPEAMRNYLARLGWSHGDQEFLTAEQMIAAFDLKAVGRSPARFDMIKLTHINGHYIREMDDAELVERFIAFLPHTNASAMIADQGENSVRRQLLQAMPGLKLRADTLAALVESARFLFAERPLSLDEKANRLLDETACTLLGELIPALEAVPSWNVETLEATIRHFADEHSLKLGSIAQPLRVALTGSTVSPGIFDVMAVLGCEETMGRLRDRTS